MSVDAETTGPRTVRAIPSASRRASSSAWLNETDAAFSSGGYAQMVRNSGLTTAIATQPRLLDDSSHWVWASAALADFALVPRSAQTRASRSIAEAWRSNSKLIAVASESIDVWTLEPR